MVKKFAKPFKPVDKFVAIVKSVDLILRRTDTEAGSIRFRSVVVQVIIWGAIAGFILGSYGWLVGARSFAGQLPQMIFSAMKVPILIGLTVLVSLPSFMVFNSLFGLRQDFADAVRAIISAQAGLTIVLCSLMPLGAFWYFSCTNSSPSYRSAILFDSVLFAVASFSGQFQLQGYYKPLIRRNPKHRWMLWVWIFLFAFVGIQAAWVMRPFIGDPNADITFFRKDPFSNAYLKIFDMISRFLQLK